MHSSHCDVLTRTDMLDWNTGGLVVCMIRIIRRLFLFTCRIWFFASYTVLPYFWLVWSFIGSNAMGFDLAGIYGRDAMTRVVDGLVPRLVVGWWQIFILGAAWAVNGSWLEFIVGGVGD